MENERLHSRTGRPSHSGSLVPQHVVKKDMGFVDRTGETDLQGLVGQRVSEKKCG